MEKNTELLVRELAEKLGTTVEHLWGVLLRQATVNIWIDLVQITLLGGALVFAYRLVQHKTTPLPGAHEHTLHPEADWSSDGKMFAWLVLAVVSLIFGGLILCGLAEMVTCAINPEYWALQQLLPPKP